jgi:hypothetical protein
MHLCRALIAAGVLLAMSMQDARAFETRLVRVVIGNFRSDDRAADFRTRLRGQLRGFAGRVTAYDLAPDVQRVIPPNLRHPVFTFELRPDDRLGAEATDTVGPGTDEMIGVNGVAAMWGSFGRGDREGVATSTIYIGAALPSENSLRLRPNLFIPVDGSLSPPNVTAYEIIIEYALLRRVWREGRLDLVIPVGNILKARLNEARGGGGTGFWPRCHRAISDATAEILRTPRRPGGTPPARIEAPPPVNCR